MIRSLLLHSLLILFCLSTIPSRTYFARGETAIKHLSTLFGNQRGTSAHHRHGVLEKRKVGGRDEHLPKRCSTSKHSNALQTTGAQDPDGANELKKWGLAWPNGDSPYLSNFARPKIGYIYTWSPYLPSAVSEHGMEGIPMLWGWNQIDDFQKMVVQGYANKVLGMNEPNEPSQSNMSPQDGVSLWKQYIEPLKSQGYYLISPACTNDQAGLDWMRAFFEECTNCTIDAIAFHFYGTDSKALKDYATTLHETYNKNIWITEFADTDFSGRDEQPSMSDIYAFQIAAIDFVDSTPWIEAAFPFGAMRDLQGVNEGNLLMTADGWPTSLAYNYFG